jgi:hypothetical protein
MMKPAGSACADCPCRTAKLVPAEPAVITPTQLAFVLAPKS